MAETKKILVVDDDATITEFVSYALRKEGYAADTSDNAEEAFALAQNNHYDLYLLDIMLPGMNGHALCQRIRSFATEPVLFLSASDSEIDKIIGLELGADDYLTKPFGIRELIARVRALLRRANGLAAARNVVTAGGFTLDENAHTISGDMGPLDLTAREFELMACLMRHAGDMLSRNDLLRDAWGWEYITETKTVDAHVKRVRDKLTAAGYFPSVIETSRGYGYRFRKDPVQKAV